MVKSEDWKNLGLKEDEGLYRTHTARYYGWGNNVTALNSILNAMRMDTNRLALTLMGDNVYREYDVFACNKKPEKRNEHRVPAPKPEDKVLQTDSGQTAQNSASGSLEALHNLYHVLIGGSGKLDLRNPQGKKGGHHSRVAVAAFDPIFWFHHCQIDRLFAIWQAIHKDRPNNWFSNSKQADQPLLPFRKSSGNMPENFWKSDSSERTDDFGYTYPDCVGTSDEVYTKFKKLYEWSVPLNENTDRIGTIPSEMEPIDFKKTQFYNRPVGSEPKPEALLSQMTVLAEIPRMQQMVKAVKSTGFAREWYIDDEVERLALNGAFTIFYFLESDNAGGVPDPSTAYALTPTLAAMNHIFAAPVELCDNCGQQEEQGQVITNTAAITSMLLDFIEIGELADLEAASVVPFLKNRLKWRVVTINGELEDPRNLAKHKHFRINISCKVSRLPRGSDDVSYEVYPEIVRDIVSRASATLTTSLGGTGGA